MRSQALYRPAISEVEDEITISTNPSSDLDLFSLWLELEAMEEKKWEAFSLTSEGFPRPRGNDKDRQVASHNLPDAPTLPSHQPWWDEGGNRTLISAPKAVEFEGAKYSGSKLCWADVKQAIWKCYAPTMGLRVRKRGSLRARHKKLHQPTQKTSLACRSKLLEGGDFYLVDLERCDKSKNSTLLWSPTLSAAIASFVADGTSSIDTLAAQNDFDQIEDQSGIRHSLQRRCRHHRIGNQRAFSCH